jgi:hypothetical protein
MAIPVVLFARAAALGIAKYLVNKWGPKKAAIEIAKREKKKPETARKRGIKTYPPKTLKKLNEAANTAERRKIIEKYPGIKPDLKIKNNHN